MENNENGLSETQQARRVLHERFGSSGDRISTQQLDRIYHRHHLRQGWERLSGTDFSDVRVHVGPEARELGALAFTSGGHIHVGHGHEHHLPHEAWHVMQQGNP